MRWQDITDRDSFLAGAIAARGVEWWEETTAEQEADSVQLAGDQRSKFLAGWQFEQNEQEQERKTQFIREYDKMSAGYEKGDPAAR